MAPPHISARNSIKDNWKIAMGKDGIVDKTEAKAILEAALSSDHVIDENEVDDMIAVATRAHQEFPPKAEACIARQSACRDAHKADSNLAIADWLMFSADLFGVAQGPEQRAIAKAHFTALDALKLPKI